MGGVGGFFAQQCVEVDAQAGGEREPQPRIDIYDEDEPVNGWDDGLENFLADVTRNPTPSVLDQTPALPRPWPPYPRRRSPRPFAAEPPAAHRAARRRWPKRSSSRAPSRSPPRARRPAGPGGRCLVAPAPRRRPSPAAAPAPEGLTAESFVSRLEQAAAHVDIDELVKLVTTGGRRRSTEATTRPSPSPRPLLPSRRPRCGRRRAAAPAPAPRPGRRSATPSVRPRPRRGPISPAAPAPARFLRPPVPGSPSRPAGLTRMRPPRSSQELTAQGISEALGGAAARRRFGAPLAALEGQRA